MRGWPIAGGPGNPPFNSKIFTRVPHSRARSDLEWGFSFVPRRASGGSSHSPHKVTCHPSRSPVAQIQYPPPMSWGLRRYQNSGTLHFITFSCYRRQPLLMKHGAAQMFEQALEEARVKYGFFVFGYVVMPEHVHLLVSEPERGTLAIAIKALKQSVARRQVNLGCGLRSSQQKDAHKQKPLGWPIRTNEPVG